MRCFGIVLGALRMHNRYPTVWIVFVFIVIECHGLPWNVQRIKRSADLEDVQIYLSRFGYLPDSCITGGCLMKEEHFHEAIMNLQAFGNIPVTGEVDEKTVELMRKSRCGLPDVSPRADGQSGTPAGAHARSKRYVLQGQTWTKNDLTWSLKYDQFPQLDFYLVENVMEQALHVWSNQSKLTFTKQRSNSADILISFEKNDHGDGFSFDGQGKVLAHAFFPGPGKGGDAHFDMDEDWSVDGAENSRSTSLFMVAAHEFGHSLGLSHSNVPGSLMFPYYQGGRSAFTLPDDDRDGIQRLYGVKNDYRPASPPQWTTTTRRQPPPRPSTPTTTTPRGPPPRPPNYPPPYNTPKPSYPDKPSYHPEKPTYPNRPRVTPTYPDRPYSPPERPYYPPQVPNPEDKVPDTCDTSYDAISILRNELFIFKDKYMWRLDDKGKLQNGYPCLIKQIWYSLPENFTHIDAVYERFNGDIIFFIGRQVYAFKGQHKLPGYPKLLTNFGLPRWLDHIDAALIWGHNHKTYFYSGKNYWRFDEEIMKVDLDYPRNISIWKGIGENIDAAFKWKDGLTYFFKGKGFWKFNDMHLRVSDKKQTASAQFWMGCPKALVDLRDADLDDELTSEVKVDDVKPGIIVTYQYEILLISVFIAIIVTISVIVTIKKSKGHSYMQPERIKR